MNFASRFAPRSDFKVLLAVLSGVLGLMTGSGPALASDVWTGPLLYFTNYTPADVDMITPSVWITRGPMHGLYNVAGGAENHYTHYLSPVQTEWSYGELSDYASLTYNSWEGWFGGAQSGGPFTTVGRDAVLHIIPEDTYIGITFLSWGVAGGGFAYARTTPSFVPEPSSAAIVTMGVVGGALYRRRRRKEPLDTNFKN